MDKTQLRKGSGALEKKAGMENRVARMRTGTDCLVRREKEAMERGRHWGLRAMKTIYNGVGKKEDGTVCGHKGEWKREDEPFMKNTGKKQIYWTGDASLRSTNRDVSRGDIGNGNAPACQERGYDLQSRG